MKLPVDQSPLNGMVDVAPTETMPGSAASRGWTASKNATRSAIGLVLRLGQRDVERQEVRRIEPGIDLLQPREAADQEPGADEERERERDLRDDETLANPLAAMLADGPRAVLQRMLQIGARPLERRRKAEDEPGRDRNRERVEEHCAVDANRFDAKLIERAHRLQSANGGDRDAETGDGADERQQNAFRQELPNQIARASRQSPRGPPSRGCAPSNARASGSRCWRRR